MHTRSPSINSTNKINKHTQSITNRNEPTVQNMRSIYPLNSKREYLSYMNIVNTKQSSSSTSSSYYSNDKQNRFDMLANEFKNTYPYSEIKADHSNSEKQVLSSTSSSYLSTSSSSSSSSLCNNLTSSSISNPQIAKLNFSKNNMVKFNSISPSSPSSASTSSSSESESPLFSDSNVNSKQRYVFFISN